jgi:hypothetical protein
MKLSMTGQAKADLFNTGGGLIEMSAWESLTNVYTYVHEYFNRRINCNIQ